MLCCYAELKLYGLLTYGWTLECLIYYYLFIYLYSDILCLLFYHVKILTTISIDRQ